MRNLLHSGIDDLVTGFGLAGRQGHQCIDVLQEGGQVVTLGQIEAGLRCWGAVSRGDRRTAAGLADAGFHDQLSECVSLEFDNAGSRALRRYSCLFGEGSEPFGIVLRYSTALSIEVDVGAWGQVPSAAVGCGSHRGAYDTAEHGIG